MSESKAEAGVCCMDLGILDLILLPAKAWNFMSIDIVDLKEANMEREKRRWTRNWVREIGMAYESIALLD